MWAIVEELRLIAAKGDLIAERCPDQPDLLAALDLLTQVAGLFVPDNDHGLAHPYRKVVLGKRTGAPLFDYAAPEMKCTPFKFNYAHEVIRSVVKAARDDGRGTAAEVEELVTHYSVSREYIYRILREGK